MSINGVFEPLLLYGEKGCVGSFPCFINIAGFGMLLHHSQVFGIKGIKSPPLLVSFR